MVRKCVYCKRVASKTSTVSFHKFPKDKKLLIRWLNNMGWLNWTPGLNTLLCSEHFDEDCLDVREKIVFLNAGSVPTVFEGGIISPMQSFEYFDCSKKTCEIIPPPPPPQPIAILPTKPRVTDEQKHRKHCIAATKHDHSYAAYSEEVVKEREMMKQKLALAKREIKLMKRKFNRAKERAKKRANNLNKITKSLRLASKSKRPSRTTKTKPTEKIVENIDCSGGNNELKELLEISWALPDDLFEVS